jgi:hypothetical protein
VSKFVGDGMVQDEQGMNFLQRSGKPEYGCFADHDRSNVDVCSRRERTVSPSGVSWPLNHLRARGGCERMGERTNVVTVDGVSHDSRRAVSESNSALVGSRLGLERKWEGVERSGCLFFVWEDAPQSCGMTSVS